MNGHENLWQAELEDAISERIREHCDMLLEQARSIARREFGKDATKIKISIRESSDTKLVLGIDGPEEMEQRLHQVLAERLGQSES